jgi:hypothetical protein
MSICIWLKSRVAFVPASCYFFFASHMADVDGEVNLQVTGDVKVPDDLKLVSDAQVADDVARVLKKNKSFQRKRWMRLSKSLPANTGAETSKEKLYQLNTMYKMIGGYDEEALLVKREQERQDARKHMRQIWKDKRNEQQRLRRIKERVNKIVNDALPELMQFVMHNEVQRRDKAALAKCVAKRQLTSKASCSKG